jgi:hypothetical protein
VAMALAMTRSSSAISTRGIAAKASRADGASSG